MGGQPNPQQSAPRQNVYFVPRDGIDREVITADICRYLGRDALVRPGTYTVRRDPRPTSTDNMLIRCASPGPIHWATHARLPHHGIQEFDIRKLRLLCRLPRDRAPSDADHRTRQAMIQDLKNDSARWEQERRKHSSGGTKASRGSPDVFVRSRKSNSPPGSGRYGGYSGAQGPSQYETSEPPYPSRSNRDSYEVVPRYPGSDAPGYSGSGGGGPGPGPTYPQYDQAQQAGAYNNAQYGSGPGYAPPAGGNFGGYNQQQAGSPAYGGQTPYGGSNAYGQSDSGPPYVNVGANSMERSIDASSRSNYAPPYAGQGQPDPRNGYYPQNQVPGGYTQPVDPFLGRGNAYPATSQADYGTSTQPAASYQYVSDPSQNKTQTPPPRAVASPSTSTQAQIGSSSGSSHARHHRDRDNRDGSYSKSDRHSRRP